MKRKILLMAAMVMISAACGSEATTEEALQVISPDVSTKTTQYNVFGQASKIVSKDGLTLLEFEYDGSYCRKATVIFYFENAGETGDYQSSVKLTEKKVGQFGPAPKPPGLPLTTTFRVEANKKYAFRITVNFGNSVSTDHDESTIQSSLMEYTIQWTRNKAVLDAFKMQVPAWDTKIETLQLDEFSKTVLK